MKTIIIDGIEYNLTPKVLFKKGDFVVIQETTYQITKVENLNVTLSLNGRECLFDIDVLKNARLWTIQDAKDGDVLAYPDGSITLFKYMDENIYMAHVLWVDGHIELNNSCAIYNVHPATKKQRDLLFSKMKEAGYEWDAKNNGLVGNDKK